jgi:hypothetical protein
LHKPARNDSAQAGLHYTFLVAVCSFRWFSVCDQAVIPRKRVFTC